jgi:hypothetical protein
LLERLSGAIYAALFDLAGKGYKQATEQQRYYH